MAVFRIERTRDYTVMSNHHLKDTALSLKAKGLLSMMLSLPDEWNYTTRGLAAICKEGVDAMENKLTYTQNGDYLIPDLKLNEEPEAVPLGKYGRMRRQYLKEHRPILFQKLVLEGKLYPHLREIDETAHRRLSEMMPQMAKEAGVTEALKAADPMKWAGLMNTLKAQAEEIILNELVFS